jgi:hypothetical protein
MLHELLTTNRAAIIAKTAAAGALRPSPIATGLVDNGVPRFLSQLSETLLAEVDGPTPAGACDVAIGESSSRHGAELLALGFTVSQVVHVYGDICQAVTEIAIAQTTAISVKEFQILNRSLDAAIAGALTEHAKLTASNRSTLRGLTCPTCHSPLTEVVALRSSAVADEYHFRCDVCDQRWSTSTPPVHSNRVKRSQPRPM